MASSPPQAAAVPPRLPSGGSRGSGSSSGATSMRGRPRSNSLGDRMAVLADGCKERLKRAVTPPFSLRRSRSRDAASPARAGSPSQQPTRCWEEEGTKWQRIEVRSRPCTPSENSPKESDGSRCKSRSNSANSFHFPSSSGTEVVSIEVGKVPARFRRTNSLAEMFQDEAVAAAARLERANSAAAVMACTSVHIQDVDEGHLPGSTIATKVEREYEVDTKSSSPSCLSIVQPLATSTASPDQHTVPEDRPASTTMDGFVVVSTAPRRVSVAPPAPSVRQPPRGGVAVDIDFFDPSNFPPSSLLARLSRAPASKLLPAQTAAPRGGRITSPQRRPRLQAVPKNRARPRPSPLRTPSPGSDEAIERRPKRIGSASVFLTTDAPIEFLGDHDTLDLEVSCTSTDKQLVSSHALTSDAVKAVCCDLRSVDAEGVQKLLEWRLALRHYLAKGVMLTPEEVTRMCEEEAKQWAMEVPTPSDASTAQAPKKPAHNIGEQARGVEKAMAAVTEERAGEEDQEVLERLKSEIEQLSQALKVPGLSAGESYALRKQLNTRRSEKARAERAVRKGRNAQLEISGGPEAVRAIVASLPTAARAPDRAERPVCFNGFNDDFPPREQHVRTPHGDGKPLPAPRPPGFDKQKPPHDMAALVLASLLHPNTLSAAGSAAIGCVGFAAKEFKSIALDASDVAFGDTAWRCACQALARERALWCPSPATGVEKKGNFWQTLLLEQLWPARRKWETSEAEGPRRLGQLGLRSDPEKVAQDFKIKVSVRFKPGEVKQGRLLVPLHQKLIMLRKAGADLSNNLGQKESPEFLDALMGHVMTDPVMLPSSGKVCDRRVIEEQLKHHGDKDPFDGSPLSAEMLVPQQELCARLLEWRTAARQRAADGGDEHKLAEDEVKELIGELGGELDPEVVEMVLEAERLRSAGKRALQNATGPRQQKNANENDGDEDQPGEDAEAEEARPWWEDNAENLGAGAAAMPAAGQRVHDGRGMADAGEEEIGEAPTREGPRLLAVTPPTRIAMFQPGTGVRPFVFAQVFDGGAPQEEVYEHTARSSVCAALNGFNACLLCYGQTGAGKTHTMFGQSVACGGNAGAVVSKQSGCVMRALRELFQAAAELQEACGVSLTFSAQYVQIYQDQVSCLSSGNAVALREAVAGAPVILQGASETELQGLGDASQLLAAGEERKRYAETAMNHRSSRAHTVLAVKVVQRHADLEVVSQLHLVDLAGSERVKKSRVQGGRLVEAVGINSSLMVLGRCIAARVEDRLHVPYYESRLTLLLRSALGGNSRTNVIVCCHKEEKHGDETLQALSFGERCAMVSTRAHAAMASSATAALASIDAALADCSRQIEGLEARGKGHLPACDKIRERHRTMARRRRELADRMSAAQKSEAGNQEASGDQA